MDQTSSQPFFLEEYFRVILDSFPFIFIYNQSVSNACQFWLYIYFLFSVLYTTAQTLTNSYLDDYRNFQQWSLPSLLNLWAILYIITILIYQRRLWLYHFLFKSLLL